MPQGLGRVTGATRLGAAVAWRGLWALEDRIRGAIWSRRLGFELRSRSPRTFTVAESGTLRITEPAARPQSDRLGVVAGDSGQRRAHVVVEAGRLYGLEVEVAATSRASALFDRAVRERWSLVSIDATAFTRARSLQAAAKAYVEGGGTLLLTDAGADAAAGVGELSRALGVALPGPLREGVGRRKIHFSAQSPGLTRELAGVSVESTESVGALDRAAGRVVATVVDGAGVRPAAVEVAVGAGAVMVTTGRSDVERLGAVVDPIQPLTALVPLMAVRRAYGDAAWSAPWRFANFIVDDPALREGKLGLDYDHVVAQAADRGFHLTIATIPRELGLASAQVVELLRSNGRWISACYHGNDHSGYEFYLLRGSRLRYRARSLAMQEQSLRSAVERGESFARRSGLALDRVMVFPHGIGSPEVLTVLQRLGFISACNFDDRYPLGAGVPDDFDLGLRPADLAWAGFPLLWRRGLRDTQFMLDLFLGRPAITFGHSKALGRDLSPFGDRADQLNAMGGVRWASLEDISRHCYLERRDPATGWHVTMMSNEICLHNPDPLPRLYTVERAHSPRGFAIRADWRPSMSDRGPTTVVVPAGRSTTVRLMADGTGTLSPGRPCSIGRDAMVDRVRERQDNRPRSTNLRIDPVAHRS